MDKQPVKDLPDITKSSNNDHIMVITDLTNNQLRKEKVSDFITDFISTQEENGLQKGNDEKLYTINTSNADNITSGTLSSDRLADTGVSADVYPYPINLQVNSKGQVMSVEAGAPGGNNANTDLSNITEAGQQVIAKYSASFSLFDTKLSDHVLEGDEAVGWALQGSLVTNTYPAAVNAIKTAYASGTDETFTLGDITFPYKKAQNGWQIADIAQKDNVDALFTQTGVAKFYVLDSANNQFYLPRENWFQQLTTDPDKVNQYNEAGLPNIEGILSSEWPIFTSAKGALKIINTASPYKIAEARSGSGMSQFGIDASLSSSIYNNSDTVQPPSSNWLLYYVVGNTITNESEIDVGNVLSDLQLKADTDLANVTAAAQNFKDMSVGWGIPDYASGVTIPSGYTAPTDGWIYAISSANSHDNYSLLYVDEIKVGNAQGGSTIQDPVSLYALVGKGSTVTFTRCTTTFYPMKGVSQNA